MATLRRGGVEDRAGPQLGLMGEIGMAGEIGMSGRRADG